MTRSQITSLFTRVYLSPGYAHLLGARATWSAIYKLRNVMRNLRLHVDSGLVEFVLFVLSGWLLVWSCWSASCLACGCVVFWFGLNYYINIYSYMEHHQVRDQMLL